MRAQYWIVRFICAFNGVCAVYCGGLMMAGAAGVLPPFLEVQFGFFDLMTPMLAALPLPEFMTDDLFWPGLALLLVNGVANLIATVLFVRVSRVRGAESSERAGRGARVWSLMAGLLLVVWCIFEMLYIPNGVSAFYLLIGVVQTVCATLLVVRK